METDYLLGSSDEELGRLSFQHEVWRPEAQALWARAGFKSGQRILDLGCGPGFASLDLALLVGAAGKVVSFDLSPKFLSHLTRVAASAGIHWIEAIQGKVEDLSLPELVDHVYSRWLFCFLPKPEIVLEKLAKVVRKGGTVAICDYFALDYILVPKSPGFDRLQEAIDASWLGVGGSVEIQQRMPALLERAGFKVREMTPISRVGRPGSGYWNWPSKFFSVFVPQLVGKGLLSQAEADVFWDEWKERERNPDALIKTPTFLDIVAERV